MREMQRRKGKTGRERKERPEQKCVCAQWPVDGGKHLPLPESSRGSVRPFQTVIHTPFSSKVFASEPIGVHNYAIIKLPACSVIIRSSLQ